MRERQQLEPYRPSNGTEGDYFMAEFCDRCQLDADWRDYQEATYRNLELERMYIKAGAVPQPCEILNNTLAYGIEDEHYPRDTWVYFNDRPTCLAFRERGDDKDGLYTSPDPTQGDLFFSLPVLEEAQSFSLGSSHSENEDLITSKTSTTQKPQRIMAHIAKGNNNTQRELPKSGLQKALCVDVYNAGPKETPWGPKDKTMIVWELTEQHPEYEGPFRINRKYTTSLHEKSNMSKDLESWRGKGYTDQERKEGVDLERLIGVGCYLNVIHHEDEQAGITYANVAAIMPLAREEWSKPSGHYNRKTDEPPARTGTATQHIPEQEARAKQRYGGSPEPVKKINHYGAETGPTPPIDAYENEQAYYIDDAQQLPF